MRIYRPAALAIALLLISTLTRADVLVLKDGRMVEGKKLTKGDKGVVVHFENGDVLVRSYLIEDAIIEGAESSFVPTTPEEKEKVEKGLVPYEGKWVKPATRDRLIERKIEAKREEIEELKEHSLWRNRWKEETKHFLFEHTLPPHVFEYYRDMMEAFYSVFERSWRVKQPRDRGKLLVCFYTNLKDFHRISGAPGGARGYFKFRPNWELNIYYDRLDPQYTTEVMFHETTHYLQQLLDPDFHFPHFVAEAMAEYYGASSYDPSRKKLTVGLMQEGRLAGIQTDAAADELLGLRKMLETDRMYQHYSYGWSLVHMLMEDRSRRRKFEKFVQALVRGRGVKQVPYGPGMKTVACDEMLKQFMKYLGLRDDEDLQELEKEWHAYIREKLTVVTSRGLEKAAKAAINTGRRIRAKRLYKEAIEAGNASALCHHEYADLIEGEQKEKALELWRKAIELDPLEAQFYESLGTALIRKGDKEEGVRLVKLALELNPDDYWLQFRVKELLEGN